MLMLLLCCMRSVFLRIVSGVVGVLRWWWWWDFGSVDFSWLYVGVCWVGMVEWLRVLFLGFCFGGLLSYFYFVGFEFSSGVKIV